MQQFPQKCPCLLISRTYEYATLHDKRDFEDVIMIVDLEWRDYPGGLILVTGVRKKDAMREGSKECK